MSIGKLSSAFSYILDSKLVAADRASFTETMLLVSMDVFFFEEGSQAFRENSFVQFADYM